MRDPIVPTRSRARIAAENRAELDGWIDERADALAAAGMTPEQARRRALEEFGDVDVAARYAEGQDVAADRRLRVVLWVEDLASDLRIALRTFARTPTVTVVVLLTFALGIGVNTAMFGVVDALLLRPPAYLRDAARVHRVYFQSVRDGVERTQGFTSVGRYLDLLRATNGLSTLAGFNTWHEAVGDGDARVIVRRHRMMRRRRQSLRPWTRRRRNERMG